MQNGGAISGCGNGDSESQGGKENGELTPQGPALDDGSPSMCFTSFNFFVALMIDLSPFFLNPIDLLASAHRTKQKNVN